VRTFDLDGRLTRYPLGADVRTLGYDDAGRITTMTHALDPSLDRQLGYDDLDRLTSIAGGGATRTYGYDASGNRTSAMTDTYVTSPSSNQLVEIDGDSARTFSYDAMGNMTSDGQFTATYDARARLASVSTADGVTSYTYDAAGQRIAKTDSSGSHYYVYDDTGTLLGEYDATGAIIREYIWIDSMPLAVVTSSEVLYVHADETNTPRALVDATNQLRWRWISDPFGATPPEEDPSGLGAVTLDLRLPGQLYDRETGLHYNYFRDYSPTAGRYVESDPKGLAGGVNTYAYALGNPVRFYDPRGLWSIDLDAIVGYGLGFTFGYDPETCQPFIMLRAGVGEKFRAGFNPHGHRPGKPGPGDEKGGWTFGLKVEAAASATFAGFGPEVSGSYSMGRDWGSDQIVPPHLDGHTQLFGVEPMGKTDVDVGAWGGFEVGYYGRRSCECTK
jgi:RHS repeat-associated protein